MGRSESVRGAINGPQPEWAIWGDSGSCKTRIYSLSEGKNGGFSLFQTFCCDAAENSALVATFLNMRHHFYFDN
jgi:hypothetical protein